MATFPTMTGGRTYAPYEPEPVEQRVTSEAADGTFRSRVLTPVSDAANIEIEYPYITKADLATVITFYNANRAIPFDFSLHDGQSATTVSMRFRTKPRHRVRDGESVQLFLSLRRLS